MDARDRAVTTPDGRRLLVREAGDPAGFPVVFHHGTPDSRLPYPPHAEAARASGVRLLAYDRPGYGGSTPQRGRQVAGCAADVRAIAHALGLERLAIWGVSGGGPHALACAALLPDLVVAAAVVAAPAPHGAAGLDYFADMGEDNVADISLSIDDPAAFERKAATDRDDMLRVSPQELRQLWQSLLSPVDAAAMSEELSAHLVASVQLGLAPGPAGYVEDSFALIAPWGFDLSAIGVPVLLRHGGQDRFVPAAHGAWIAARVPGARADLLPGEGHLTLFLDSATVLAWLMDQARAD